MNPVCNNGSVKQCSVSSSEVPIPLKTKFLLVPCHRIQISTTEISPAGSVERSRESAGNRTTIQLAGNQLLDEAAGMAAAAAAAGAEAKVHKTGLLNVSFQSEVDAYESEDFGWRQRLDLSKRDHCVRRSWLILEQGIGSA
jgi:hypothetical protein